MPVPRIQLSAPPHVTDAVSSVPSLYRTVIVDGSVRRKFQQAQFFNYLDPVTFLYNLSAASPMNYVDTVMTTSSVTPRLDVSHRLFGVANRLLTGVDFYNTQYNSDRPAAPGLVRMAAT